MRTLLIALLATLPGVAFANANSEEKTIVVTGQSLSDTKRSLDECIARKCKPDEDAKATLAHAENQFVAGDYKGARQTLQQSLGRNGGEAKDYPVPVSDLYRANARIAVNLGEKDSYRLSTIQTRDALAAGLPDDDWRVLVANIEVGDMRARLGYRREAANIYERVKKKAEARGYKTIAVVAELRMAVLLINSPNSDEVADGRRLLNKLANMPGQEAANLRLAAKIILVRKARSKEEADRATDALIAEQRSAGQLAKEPIVLFAPPLEQPGRSLDGAGKSAQDGLSSRTPLNQMQTETVDNNWIDVGFWVTPSGQTGDVEIIRQSRKDVNWAKPVIAQITGRRYAPLDLPPGDPGFYMVERYTLTAFWEDRLGTRIRQRSPILRIERIDLTEDQPKAAQAEQ